MNDTRTIEQKRHHFEVEKELADRLKRAPAQERPRLYGRLYDELWRRVPDHPQLKQKNDPEFSAKRVHQKLKLLRRYLGREKTFLEIGAGDCQLSIAAASFVKKVIAQDVSREITESGKLPANLEIKITDGIDLGVPDDSIDLAYSNQLMEHLHPDDAKRQLQNIYRALKSGGQYIIITPHRLSGPHDISRYFSDTAQGFHLHEYTYRELVDLLHQIGFTSFATYWGGKGWYWQKTLESTLAQEDKLNFASKEKRHSFLSRAILGINLIAQK